MADIFKGRFETVYTQLLSRAEIDFVKKLKRSEIEEIHSAVAALEQRLKMLEEGSESEESE